MTQPPPSLYAVALCELAASLADEEEPVAAILGVAAYDARTRLAGALPKIVHQAGTIEECVHVAEALRRRGHGAIVLDPAEAMPLGQMVQMRRFTLDAGTIYANDRKPPSHALEDVVAIVRLVLQQQVQRTHKDIEYRYTNRGPMRTQVERTSGESHAEDALVLFFAEGPPWVLRAREGRYLALGSRIRPTVRENFLATVDWLRLEASRAMYDDRFVTSPLVSARLAGVRGAGDPALRSDRNMDLRVFALGTWLARGQKGPYRAVSRRVETPSETS